MGRRKQFCPQKTGGPDEDEEGQQENSKEQQQQREGSMAESSEVDEVGSGALKKAKEQQQENSNVDNNTDRKSPKDTKDMIPTESPLSGTALPSEPKALADALKMQLVNPTLLAINPQMYAMQLAQLQAGIQQLVAAAATATAASANNTSADKSRNAASSSSPAASESGDEDPVNLSSHKSKSPMSSDEPSERTAESPLDLSGSKGAQGNILAGGPPLGWPALSFLHPLLRQQQQQQAFSASSPGAILKNPLEHISEVAKLNQQRFPGPGAGIVPTSPVGQQPGNHRQSAWQSQWKNKVPETTSDIFKCVSCRDSFPSLQALTAHMRETGHYMAPATKTFSPKKEAAVAMPPVSPSQAFQYKPRASIAAPRQASPQGNKNSRDILKEHLPIPRKLVRGQDVWLGKGEEQTRNILKCMYCGQSFRSLDMLTTHMQETKHYKKVMSQEQISNWKPSPSSGTPPNSTVPSISPPSPKSPGMEGTCGGGDVVGNVLRCLACSETFSSLKMLTEHIVKTGHQSPGSPGNWVRPYTRPAEHENGPTPSKRPKSLPVKALLEIERQQKMQQRLKQQKEEDNKEEGRCMKCGQTMPVSSLFSHGLTCGMPSSVSPNNTSSSMGSPSIPLSPPTVSPATSIAAATPVSGSSSFKSILGSLESMVHHNFNSEDQLRKQRPSGIKSVDDFLHTTLGGQGTSTSRTPSTSPTSARPHTASPAVTRKSLTSPNNARQSPPRALPPSSAQGHNPLEALQQLCASTDGKKKSPATLASGSTSSSSSPAGPPSSTMCDPSSIVAFSWAVNQAAASDSGGHGFKCPFCETTFSTKGAYRHHLSKVHFMKDGSMMEKDSKAPPPPQAAEGEDGKGDKDTSEAKYHKYAELAKQLSSSRSKAPLSTLA